MTNPTNAYGFKPVGTLSGKPWNAAIRPVYIPSTNSTSFFKYDPVYSPAAGGSSNTTTLRGYKPGSLPVVDIATATSMIMGVIVGWEPLQGWDTPIYGKASTDRIAQIVCDPDIIYRIRDNGYTALGTTAVELNAYGIAGTGNSYTGISGWMMDAGTTHAPAATQGAPLTIINAVNSDNNDATLAYSEWLVRINLHQFNPYTAGV